MRRTNQDKQILGEIKKHPAVVKIHPGKITDRCGEVKKHFGTSQKQPGFQHDMYPEEFKEHPGAPKTRSVRAALLLHPSSVCA